MTIATLTIEDQGDELTAGARSYVYQMLATAFSYPSEDFVESLASGEWSQRLLALSEHLPFGLTTIEPSPATEDRGALQQGYVSTFEVGTGRPFCPLYEGSHRSGRMKLMEDLVRFYEHFGLMTQPGDHPDHLCAELEFMHYMAFKEAAAHARSEPVPDLQRAQRDFLDRHLCKWLPRVRARLASARDLPAFYFSVAALTEEFCRQDLAWLKAA